MPASEIIISLFTISYNALFHCPSMLTSRTTATVFLDTLREEEEEEGTVRRHGHCLEAFCKSRWTRMPLHRDTIYINAISRTPGPMLTKLPLHMTRIHVSDAQLLRTLVLVEVAMCQPTVGLYISFFALWTDTMKHCSCGDVVFNDPPGLAAEGLEDLVTVAGPRQLLVPERAQPGQNLGGVALRHRSRRLFVVLPLLPRRQPSASRSHPSPLPLPTDHPASKLHLSLLLPSVEEKKKCYKPYRQPAAMAKLYPAPLSSIVVVLLASILYLPCDAFSADRLTDRRLLVLVDDLALRYSHSRFFSSLRSRGYELDFNLADYPSLALRRYGQFLCFRLAAGDRDRLWGRFR
ncbi:hypothetical protein B296_00014982 [Ensete ventricosum]|uniref:Uncharacterized protein n=1 Tax=Ensete ventricosum TaxID=4639 RepID=A0A427B028_ENSVE|nr:hypothetical protein B296_00014982 [Ensete ventricosum]